ncbi:hypothetical protein HK413_12075 [Mucilaginibacter sp. S1162]|uniref:Carboxypeptidase regulatory-like domain-containing protein n=1 Tax=Mucilaginibacter humi TaxID=2732510 RepID=A0ABX1W4M3_9SPHI|nr:hypothetical protein [Mucilaginibacter humi]NNU34626.1 hypothetical protein [Mucilaginibacter humi]
MPGKTRAQRKKNTFHIIDSLSNKPVTTSVTIVRAKLFITTENDGIFVIPGDLSAMRDTIIFNAQSYEPLKMTLHDLDGRDIIKLKKYEIAQAPPGLNFKNDTLLNDFDRDKVEYYAGISTGTEVFNYRQLAQKFTLKNSGVKLTGAKIIRLVFNAYYEEQHTKYRLRIYDVDNRTGGPGKDLASEVIEISSSDGQQNNANLKKYNIIIPNKTFFIAIEWMRDYHNASFTEIYEPKQYKSVKIESYKPTIGLSPIQGKELNIWAMNFKGEWKPYTYFMPFGTDTAIKAVVEY